MIFIVGSIYKFAYKCEFKHDYVVVGINKL